MTVYKYCVCVCLGTPVHECVYVLAHACAFVPVSMGGCDIDLHICKCVGIDVCFYILSFVYRRVHISMQMFVCMYMPV